MTTFDVALMIVTDDGERPVVATVSDTTLVADLAKAAGASPSTTLARQGERLDPAATLAAAGVHAGDTLRLGGSAVGDWKRLGPELRVIGGVDAGKRRRISEAALVVGRDSKADFVLSSTSVSRRHATLQWTGGELVVRDLGSRHGTFVDGRRLAPDEVAVVVPYSAIGLGDSVVTVAAGPEPSPAAETRAHRVAPRDPSPRRSYAPFVVPSAGALAFAAAATGAPAPLALAATPAALLAGLGVDRVLTQRAQRRAEAVHGAGVAAVAAAMRDDAAAFARASRAQFCDPAALLALAERRSASLWAQAPDELVLRVGLASVGDAVHVDADEPDSRALTDAGTAHLVPITLSGGTGPVAVIGPEPFLDDLFTWLVVQAVASVAPEELELLVVSDDLDRWAWTALLPHARSRAVVGSSAVTRGLPGAERARRLVVVDRVRSVDVGPHDLVFARQETSPGRFGEGWTLRASSPAHVTMSDASRATRAALADLPGDATQFALAMALHLAAVGGQRNARAAVPSRVRLPEIVPAVTDAASVARGWRRAGDPLVAVIGADEHGPVAVALEGAASHVLVAGTTGAGKTRLLETLALGLAANYAPSALNLMTIDFKGGNELAGLQRLPHCVGAVSDRDPVEVDRAIAAISRELARRDETFAAAQATDRDDYVAKTASAMPHLVVIADEFGQFRREDGTGTRVAALLRIAAQGRSKGVHLVLATQSPSIDVTADIRQNVGVRLCLRVAEPAESVAVLGTIDAMALAQPGRVVVAEPDRTRVAQVALSRGPVVINGASEQPVVVRDLVDVAAGRAESPSSLPTELFDAIVDTITIAARTEGYITTPLLGPPLPPRVARDALPGADLGWTKGGLVFAQRDRPGVAAPAPVVFEPARHGSLTVIGGPRSGRTTTLLSIADAVRAQADPLHPVVVHAVDWSGGLDTLSGAACDGGVVAHRDFDHLRRTLTWLRGPGVTGTTRLVLVDRYDALLRDLRDVDTALATEIADVLQSGPRRRVFSVATVDPMSLVGGAAQLGGMRLVLPVDDPSVATAAGLPRRSLAIPGRGIVFPDGDDVQVGLPNPAASTGTTAPGHVGPMPRAVTASDLPAARGEEVVIGVGGDDVLAPLIVDLERAGPCVVVIGRRGSGRSNALAAFAATYNGARTIVRGEPGSDPSLVLVDDAAQVPWLNDPELPDALRAGGHVLVAAFDQADLPGLSYGHWLLRRPHTGLLLSLDATSDRIIAGERVGFHPPTELRAGPPGRGWWCERGRGTPVQVADTAP